jgi:4'-phosphopantetheinyl transferase
MTGKNEAAMREPQWLSTTQVTPFTAGDLHVWRVCLNLATGANQHLWSLLCDAEQQRAKRFVRPQDQEKFVQVRGVLRVLLGEYLGIAGSALQFDYTEYGKPQLAASCNPLRLEFNVSHSHQLAVIAVSCAIAVGIDVEHINDQVHYQNISQRFFADQEHEILLQQPPSQQRQAFFQLWTCKEACIKAIGGSIAHALDRVVVAESIEQSLISVDIMDQGGNLQPLSVQTLNLGEDYRGAVATPERFPHLCTWEWDPRALKS